MKTTVFIFIMYCGCMEACQVQYSYRLSFALSNTEQCVIMAGCKCKHFSFYYQTTDTSYFTYGTDILILCAIR